MITFIDLGNIDYQLAWDYQEKKLKKVYDESHSSYNSEFILICEHPHVYTLGKSGKQENLLINYLQLQANNAKFVKSNRGGDITYHGPGQIVGYPILNLSKRQIGVKKYIEKLESSIISFLTDYGIEGQRNKNAIGVWLDVGTIHERKICSIGIRVSRSITMHGFALNINTDLKYFSFINPCGFTDKKVTSLQKELGRTININKAKTQLIKQLISVFDKHEKAMG